MTRIAFTSDWHIDEYLAGVDPETGANRRLMDFIRTAGWVAREAVRQGCDALVIGGDLTERKHPSAWLVARIQEAVMQGPDVGVVVRGNHDGEKNGRSIVDVLGRLPGWTGVGRPDVIRFGELAICAIPYMDRHHLRAMPEYAVAPDADVFRALSASYVAIARGLFAEAVAGGARRTILVGHQTLSGGHMSDSQEAFLGGLSLVVDSHQLAAIGYDAAVFGHLHRAQTVVTDPCPVTYCGSIERVDFGEQDEEKSFLIADIPESGTITLERVETPARRFVTLSGSDGWFVGEGALAGAVVRVRDLDPVADPAEVRRQLMEVGGAFEVTSIERRRTEAPVIEGGLSEALSPHQALDAWFAQDADRPVLVELGHELLAGVTA